ncbi:MAG: DUF1800 domain-containing protein [Gemmatimonadaceae bacterium]
MPALASVRELTPRQQALQALNRLAFGPRPGDVDSVTAMGVDRWIDLQLTPNRIHDRVDDMLAAHYPTLSMSAEALLRAYPPPGAVLVKSRLRGDTMLSPAERLQVARDARGARAFVGELMSAKVARAVVSDRQLQEVMTDFWENHFTVFVGKNQVRYALPDFDRETIRPHALGRFRDLLGAVAKSPAMLLYLDNALSVADSGRRVAAPRARARLDRVRDNPPRGLPGRRRLPADVAAAGAARGRDADGPQRVQALVQQRRPRGLNENYARELLELHTLGVDGGYTQQDVIEVARALTGWTVRPPRLGAYGFFFNPAAHDAEPKHVLGHTLKGGRGIEDGEEVLDIVARHPSTATFIARKLAIRLVSDTPPGALVARAAETFQRTDGDIREVVRTIVTSPEFFSRAAYRTKVKSPFEVVVSASRALGAEADTTPRSAAIVAQLGQPIYGHQAPNGWPETGESWMNTGAILNRINFGLAVAGGRVPGVSVSRWPAFDALMRRSPQEQTEGLIDALLGGEASTATREVLESGKNPFLERARADSTLDDDALEGAGDAMMARDTPVERVRRAARPLNGRPVSLNGLAQKVGLALGSPEFQRR